MPTARFIVEISASQESANRGYVIVANTVKWLAYADTTDLFGYHGKIELADVSPLNKVVTIEFVAPVSGESQISDFLDEMAQLARVEEAECVSNPTIA